MKADIPDAKGCYSPVGFHHVTVGVFLNATLKIFARLLYKCQNVHRLMCPKDLRSQKSITFCMFLFKVYGIS